MDLPVGDQDGPGKLSAGDLCHGPRQGAEKTGAPLVPRFRQALVHPHDFELEVVETGHRRLDPPESGLGLGRAAGNGLAARLIDDHNRHVRPG